MQTRVAIEVSWPMGHRLQQHDGKCAGLHGHNYRLRAVFSGLPRTDPELPMHGMVEDFARLKAAVRAVTDPLDHAMLLERGDPAAIACEPFANVVRVPFPPTAERLAAWFYEQLEVARVGALVETVTLWESDATYAEVGQ